MMEYSNNAMMLSWRRSNWKLSQSIMPSANDKKIMDCVAKGWHGTQLTCVSDYELDLITTLLSTSINVLIIWAHQNRPTLTDGKHFTLTNCLEVWVEHESDVVRLNNLLPDIPPRTRLAKIRIPINPIVEPLLDGLNYRCAPILNSVDVGEAETGGMLSIQEHDGIDRLLAILALTQ